MQQHGTDPLIKRAIISVTDKTGVVAFAKTLWEEFGVEIVSTGGTAKAIALAGIPVKPIDELTGFPEMMDGRVKTLHPAVHGGLLARRDNPEHMAAAAQHDIGMIDMIVVNLYQFEKTVADPEVTFGDAIEHIDIGGPSMLRSAAKNHESVAVVTSPSAYDDILAEMRENGGTTTLETRRKLALEVFRLTSAYDNAIYVWFQGKVSGCRPFADDKRVMLEKVNDLRYGENPHQKAAFYRRLNSSAHTQEHTLAVAEQLQGKELSYNNYLDLDAAWAAVREFDEVACVIVKHLTPCGVAVAATPTEAYQLAYECDPVSAYGGVMAFNRPVTGDTVERIFANKQFIEGIIAPDFDEKARELYLQKKNARLLVTGGVNPAGKGLEFRAVEGGMLSQTLDAVSEDPSDFTVPTKREPTAEERQQLLFAWKACKSVKSNAILIAKGTHAVGIGGGQPNRVNSARIAVDEAGEKARGAVAASDAFMPFSDSLEVLASAGVTAIIQPGGSIRDQECIEAADKAGVAMLFTGHRHFRH
jgi:phosphoribosylaminoimidazolecarboxamide formyltransferase/IMP cyclohydrolase